VAFEDFTGVVLGGALLSRFTDVWTAYTIAASQGWVHALFFHQEKRVSRHARVHELAVPDATFQVTPSRPDTLYTQGALLRHLLNICFL
jgi:hypothetical protein